MGNWFTSEESCAEEHPCTVCDVCNYTTCTDGNTENCCPAWTTCTDGNTTNCYPACVYDSTNCASAIAAAANTCVYDSTTCASAITAAIDEYKLANPCPDWTQEQCAAAYGTAYGTAPVVTATTATAPTAPAWSSMFSMSTGKDIGGGDGLGAYWDGSDAAFCAEKCLADTACRGFIHVLPGNPWLGGRHGCALKTTTGLVTKSDINAYIRN